VLRLQKIDCSGFPMLKAIPATTTILVASKITHEKVYSSILMTSGPVGEGSASLDEENYLQLFPSVMILL
jgi:hypothetical protein